MSAKGNAHVLRATPATCYWGYLDRDQPPVLAVDPGDVVEIEAVSHHAGDAPDLMMDDELRALWAAIPQVTRAPGVHLMTGPIEVRGARPGDAVVVRILDMRPRLPYGSNLAAHWGLLYKTFGKERVTIYELDDPPAGAFGATARALFGFDFTGRALYDRPGWITDPDPAARQPCTRSVAVPVRPHFGVMGVAPAQSGRLSSVPPGVFGGNVDNWRIGPGATMRYPVFVEGANLYVGDPHFAQGDGEVCGTAIEASLTARVEISIESRAPVTAPQLETDGHWFTHGFGDDLDEAMTMAVEQMLALLRDRFSLTADDAYSLASVAVDVGVTQVVDGRLGCHASIAKSILT
jgi:acetamidase/formamidase